MVERGVTGPARSSPQPPRQRRWPAGPGLRAPVQSAIIVHGMRVLQAVAGRGRPGREHCSPHDPSPPAANRPCVSQVRTTSPLSSCDPVGRITSHPVGGRHPHQNSSCTRTRGSEGRGHSVRRRLAAKALTGHRPPRPAKPYWSADFGLVCDLKLSGRRPPERRPGSRSATARPAAFSPRRRWRSGAPARAPFRRAGRTID